jgi:NAD(P)-dependent dehydrogenase (short-subunit alcohol dehydrogenase family)
VRSIPELSDLSGRVALVTGGLGHVGHAAAGALEELGARVAVLDLERDDAPGSAGRDLYAADLRDEAATRAAVRAVLADLGRLDVLVHAAAHVAATPLQGWAVPFVEQSAAAWDDVLRVNLTSAFVLVHEAADALARDGRGSVILVSSIYGMSGPDLRLYDGLEMGNPAGYAASKGGLTQLGRWLATALAPTVRVNTVSLGGVARRQPPAFVARYEARTPLGRMATEEDAKGAIAFLASDQSAYVTGHNLVVDGGWTAW